MKKIFLILFTFILFSSAFPQTSNLLKGGEKPSFSYTECFNKLPSKKDRYCNQYDYTFYIKDQTLYIIETKTTEVDRPKKASSRCTEYKIAIKDIDINRSINELKYSNETSRIKNMEGSVQNFFRFTIYSQTVDGIKTMEYGKVVGLETVTVYCDSYSDAKDFLNYLMAGNFK